MKKISFIFSSRREFIRLVPVIQAFRKHLFIEVDLCFTGQNREMMENLFELFKIHPTRTLNVAGHLQNLPGLTARSINEVTAYLKHYEPEYVAVQGDSTTAMSTALAAYYQKIPLIHIGSGARLPESHVAFPHSMNRSVMGKIAALHYVVAADGKDILEREGVSADDILVAGNTISDTLRFIKQQLNSSGREGFAKPVERRMVLINGSSREDSSDNLISLCRAIQQLAVRYPQFDFVYPVKLHAKLRTAVFDLLTETENIMILEPLEYKGFIDLMMRADLILTDSHSVEEEALCMGKPVCWTGTLNTSQKPLSNQVEQGLLVELFSKFLDQSLSLETKSSIEDHETGTAADRIVKHFEHRFLKPKRSDSIKSFA